MNITGTGSRRHVTDNAHLASKLALRRSFLKQHPAGDRRLVVFDACQGEGVIWKRLRQEYPVTYFGVDVKEKAGRLKVDSARILERPGWRYDVVDVDTYGQPWRHWSAIIRHGSGTITVFLTVGEDGRAPLSADGLRSLGLGQLADVMPYGLKHQLSDFALDSLLAMSYTLGWRIERFAESTRGRNARYFGVRIVKPR